MPVDPLRKTVGPRAGASRAAKYGALAVLVRSLSTELDDRPHTGALVYEDKYPKIAAVCLSTNDAEVLSKTLSLANGNLKVFVRTTCEMQADAPSDVVKLVETLSLPSGARTSP